MSSVYRVAERAMGMNGPTWARHANPWSVYTRFTMLPLLALAIWSRVWVGGWAWVGLLAVMVWIWVNPRAFPSPASLDNWASRGVLGERVFLKRPDEVAAHHRHWAALLSAASLPGALAMAVGLWRLDAVWTVFGTILMMVPKIWFVDRMNWVYADWLRQTGKELGDV